MMLSLTQILNTVMLLALSWLLAKRLSHTGHERSIQTLTLFLSAVIAISAMAGYVELNLSPLVYSALIALLLLLEYRWLRKYRPDAAVTKKHIPQASWSAMDRVLLGLLGLVAGYELFCIAVLPEFGWDSIVYHVSNLPYWVQNKNLLPYPTSADYATFSPLNGALLNLWFFQVLGIDLLIELPGLVWGGLAGLAVYGIAREMKIKQTFALWSAAFYCCLPLVLINVKNCNADMPMAAFFWLPCITACAWKIILNGLSFIFLVLYSDCSLGPRFWGFHWSYCWHSRVCCNRSAGSCGRKKQACCWCWELCS